MPLMSYENECMGNPSVCFNFYMSLLTQDVGDGKMGETKRDQGRREFRKIQSEVLKLKL